MKRNSIGLAYYYARNLYEMDMLEREISRAEADIENISSENEAVILEKQLKDLEREFQFLKTKNLAIKEVAGE